jgi:hypothetical protein
MVKKFYFWGIYWHDLDATFMSLVETEPSLRNSAKFKDDVFNEHKKRTFRIARKDIKL